MMAGDHTPMRVALVGYGKMGRAIERLAASAGAEIVLVLDEHNNASGEGIRSDEMRKADVAIEFTAPGIAERNLQALAIFLLRRRDDDDGAGALEPLLVQAREVGDAALRRVGRRGAGRVLHGRELLVAAALHGGERARLRERVEDVLLELPHRALLAEHVHPALGQVHGHVDVPLREARALEELAKRGL